jgi:uncharacterized membrane protein
MSLLSVQIGIFNHVSYVSPQHCYACSVIMQLLDSGLRWLYSARQPLQEASVYMCGSVWLCACIQLLLQSSSYAAHAELFSLE